MPPHNRRQTIGIIVVLIALIVSCYISCGTRQKMIGARIHSHLREVHRVLHDYLEHHDRIWPKDPKKMLADAYVPVGVDENDLLCVFTQFDSTPAMAYRWAKVPWLHYQNSATDPSGIQYLLFPDGHIEEQQLPMVFIDNR